MFWVATRDQNNDIIRRSEALPLLACPLHVRTEGLRVGYVDHSYEMFVVRGGLTIQNPLWFHRCSS